MIINHPLALTIIEALRTEAVEEKMLFFPRFFKCGKGEYGEGDEFFGVTVPKQRAIAGKYWKMVDAEVLAILLHHPVHEVRLTAVIMLTKKYQKANSQEEKDSWAIFYIKHRSGINNWDLVDISAPLILGDWLLDRDKSLIYAWAKDGSLWEKRMAMLSTLAGIRKNRMDDTLKIAHILHQDKHDLIQKAVGWMIRELGKRDYRLAFDFLKGHYAQMPRTMLRYAIEKFDPKIRQGFLKGTIE